MQKRKIGMEYLLKGLWDAVWLVISLDPDMMQIIMMSLQVSGIAVLLAGVLGVSAGTYLGLRPLNRVRLLTKLVYTFMGFPPVVAGLVVLLILSAQGPLGYLQLLFTPGAMIIVQTVLAFPIITGLTMMGIREKDSEVRDTVLSLGASGLQLAWTVIREARYAIMGALVAGFGRVVAEVGAVMLVGGNIHGYTQVMTTAIVQETRQGNFEFAIGLGLVLMMIAFIFNSIFYRLQSGVGRY